MGKSNSIASRERAHGAPNQDCGFGDSFTAKWPWPLPLPGPKFPYSQAPESVVFSQQCFVCVFKFFFQGIWEALSSEVCLLSA